MLFNRILEEVVKNLPIINAGGGSNKLGGAQVTFPNPEDGWIPSLRWREMRLNKYRLEDITEAEFFATTTQEYCHVPP